MVSEFTPTQRAPGSLEEIRELVNSWLIPNDTRQPTDRFEEYARRHRIPAAEWGALRQLREALRAAIEHAPDGERRLNRWLGRVGLAPVVVDGSIAYRHRGGLIAQLVATVVEAIASSDWARLKACPDCRWVFFDRTRNAGKRWCLMTAGGPNGRSCGSIAKVRRYRERNAARECG